MPLFSHKSLSSSRVPYGKRVPDLSSAHISEATQGSGRHGAESSVDGTQDGPMEGHGLGTLRSTCPWLGWLVPFEARQRQHKHPDAA